MIMSTSSLRIQIPFNEQDANEAHEAWGCNCGPAALAAVLEKSLDAVRPAVMQADFAARGYMNLTMMQRVLGLLGARVGLFHEPSLHDPPSSFPRCGLVRIQWTGPWIINGKPARWAATATHWIATFRGGESRQNNLLYVFDVNGGLRRYDSWLSEIVPAIIASVKRSDGGWYPTHCWEIERAG